MASRVRQTRNMTQLPIQRDTKNPFANLCATIAPTGLYTYCSQPKPVERPKYRNDIARPRGVHDYYNLMWDPHVYRGTPFVPFDKEEEERERLKAKQKRDKKFHSSSFQKRSKLNQKKLGGINIPSTPPDDSRNNQLIQTEGFLEEIVGDVEEIDACTQTDAIHEQPIPEAYIPAKFGIDVATEILPCDLFDFTTEVCPIVENMVNKILEQALIEVMEEEELEALRDQQRAYEELRRQELLRLKRLVDREQKIQIEQQRLMEKLHDEKTLEVETEDRIGSYLFASNYLKGLVPNSMECLRRDGHLENRGDIFADLVPWLNKGVNIEMQSSDISRQLLDDLLKNVTSNRHLEMVNLLKSSSEAETQQMLNPYLPDATDSEYDE